MAGYALPRPPRPPQPAELPQNPMTPAPAGSTRWVRAHWRWDARRRQWVWVPGHWSR
jgi:hypothetical protein